MRSIHSMLAKLTAAIVIIVAVLLSVSASGLINNTQLAQMALTLAETSLPSIDYIIEADRDMQQAFVAERSLLFVEPGSQQFRDLKKEHDENIQQASDRVGKYEKLSPGSEAAKTVDRYQSLLSKWKATSDNVVSLAAQGTPESTEKAKAMSFAESETQFEAARDILDGLTGNELNRAADLTTNVKTTVSESRFTITGIAVFGLVVSILMAIAFPRMVVKPIRFLTTRLDDISSGEADLTVRLDADRRDELGHLAQAFNKFVARIQSLIGEVGGATSQVAAAAEQLSAVANDANRSSKRQHSETSQVATAITQMTATVQEVAQHAEQAADAANNADNNADEGREVVVQTIQRINQLADSVERSGDVIQRLEEDSRNIGTVLDVIRNIAEQTNLLALNAAIEAARAGDQGRGFSVVADEVRTLAGRTQQSTQEIQEIIEKLQNASNEAVKVMEEGRSEAQATVAQASQTREILDSIIGSISTISGMNQQIATAAEEQSSVASEIDRNINNISSLGEQTAESADQTSLSGEELTRLAAQLQQMVSSFRV